MLSRIDVVLRAVFCAAASLANPVALTSGKSGVGRAHLRSRTERLGAGRFCPVPLTATALAMAVLVTACGGGGSDTSVAGLAAPDASGMNEDFDDDDLSGKFDTAGLDDGDGSALVKRASATALANSAAPTNGGPEAHIKGAFGPVMPWPLIAIHVVLLPDGRVMSYGSNLVGRGGGDINYAIWDPALGSDPGANLVLPNTTRANIFCNGQIVIPGTGEVLLLGGTRTDAYGRGSNGTDDAAIFSPTTNTIRRQAVPMADQRWYATVVTTSEGDQVVMGGRGDKGYPWTSKIPFDVAATYAPTPAVYRTGEGWRALSSATSDIAYGNAASYGYPRAWWSPQGSIFVMNQLGEMFNLDSSGTGSILKYPSKAPRGSTYFSSAMFAPGKILSMRALGRTVVVDINGSTPVITDTQPISAVRYDGVATVLADGQVFANGGSTVRLDLSTAIYDSEIWNPTTGTWSKAATASKSRLYHSSALLLPDATVLTSGGGKPGPVRNLNAEVYFPPYLYSKSGNGEFAARPTIKDFPDRMLTWGEDISFQVLGATQASRVTLVRSGSMTHSFNGEQRFMDVNFTQSGETLTVSVPSSRNITPPGYYMMFVFNNIGVPSIAKIVKIDG